jgi:hypothetical protein
MLTSFQYRPHFSFIYTYYTSCCGNLKLMAQLFSHASNSTRAAYGRVLISGPDYFGFLFVNKTLGNRVSMFPQKWIIAIIFPQVFRAFCLDFNPIYRQFTWIYT